MRVRVRVKIRFRFRFWVRCGAAAPFGSLTKVRLRHDFGAGAEKLVLAELAAATEHSQGAGLGR